MNLKFTVSSLRWKIVFIYFLLVFIATTIIGVFIMGQMETYFNSNIRSNLTNTVDSGTMLTSLSEYDSLEENYEEIQNNVIAWTRNVQGEIFVVDDDFRIIASNNENVINASAHGILDTDVILQGLNGERAELDSVTASNRPTKNMAFPIGNDEETIGVLYLRADLTSVYETIDQSKQIFVRAMVIALAITVILGFFIARSITVPINDVTEKAEKMAQGDFSQDVSIKANDEIGRLAEMFNLLRARLNETLSEISNEKSKLETILRYMADGLIAVDLKGRIIHANHAAMEMLHISDDDVENKNYDEIIRPYRESLLLENMIRNSAADGMEETFDYSGLTFAVRYDRFKDDNQNDIGIIMMMQDITERQKLENMQMDFVANVSHELKTPLTTIKSYTETLMDGTVYDYETIMKFLGIVDIEADRMNRLVKELLQLSRMEYQQEKWHKKDGNIISVINAAVTKIEMTAKNKEQHLNILFDLEETILAVIDRDTMEQVILNVLSNAIKYTQEGGRIDIDVFVVEGTINIIVTDNGIGIGEKELPRIFERFYRVDKARSRAMGGTGLGLAISKQIVEEHNGTIEVESKEGKGTKVTIKIPSSPIRGVRNID